MNKNKEIHRLRGLAISAVVLIHVINLALLNLEFSITYKSIHTLLQFAVPCFIFISSLVFAISLEGKVFNAWGYYKKKFIVVVIPYVVWTVVYLLPQMILGHISFDKLLSPSSWFYWLAYGKAYTHLYFMSVIIQFYLVAPLMYFGIKWLYSKIKTHQYMIMLSLVILPQLVIYWVNRLYIYEHFKATGTLFVWYWCMSALGFCIGINYPAWKGKFKKYKMAYAIWFVISMVVYMVCNVMMWYKLPLDTFIYQIAWYNYVMAASLGLLQVAIVLKDNKVSRWLDRLAEYSFEIYLIHPLFTFVLSRIVKTENYLILAMVVVLGYILITWACCLLAKIARGYRVFSWTVGKYEPLRQVTKAQVEIRDKIEG